MKATFAALFLVVSVTFTLGQEHKIFPDVIEKVTVIPPDEKAALAEENRRLQEENAARKEEARALLNRMLAAEEQLKILSQKQAEAARAPAPLPAPVPVALPQPIPPQIDLARAQTLARSSRNPEAQREGMRQLQEWQAYQQQLAVFRQAQAGKVTQGSARAALARLDADQQADRQAAAQEEQRRDLQEQLDRQRYEFERYKRDSFHHRTK